mmetsp:Transcript_2241/g.6044  ORF Transcript_2241/g.6044 Transcript_2241/m.6044 type:complete len:308 (-) Transcript_2241:2026-2949(-)
MNSACVTPSGTTPRRRIDSSTSSKYAPLSTRVCQARRAVSAAWKIALSGTPTGSNPVSSSEAAAAISSSSSSSSSSPPLRPSYFLTTPRSSALPSFSPSSTSEHPVATRSAAKHAAPLLLPKVATSRYALIAFAPSFSRANAAMSAASALDDSGRLTMAAPLRAASIAQRGCLARQHAYTVLAYSCSSAHETPSTMRRASRHSPHAPYRRTIASYVRTSGGPTLPPSRSPAISLYNARACLSLARASASSTSGARASAFSKALYVQRSAATPASCGIARTNAAAPSASPLRASAATSMLQSSRMSRL